MESLILAQNERWRRVLSMQVERQGWCLHYSDVLVRKGAKASPKEWPAAH